MLNGYKNNNIPNVIPYVGSEALLDAIYKTISEFLNPIINTQLPWYKNQNARPFDTLFNQQEFKIGEDSFSIIDMNTH